MYEKNKKQMKAHFFFLFCNLIDVINMNKLTW